MKKLYVILFYLIICNNFFIYSQDLQIELTPNSPSLLSPDHTLGSGGSLLTMPDGRIYHFFRLDPGINGNHVGNTGAIAQRISYDHGETWGPVSIIFDDEYDDRFATAYRLDNGTLVVIFFRYFCYDTWNGVPIDSDIIYSTDDGITWSSRFLIPNPIQTTCFQNIFKIPGKQGYFASAYSNSVVELRHSPDGLNWDSVYKVWDYRGNPFLKINEPFFCALPDGKVIGLFRVENMPIHQVVSSDYGETWSSLMPTNLANGYFCPEPIIYYDSLFNKIVTIFADRRGASYDMQNYNSGIWVYFSDPNQIFNNPMAYSKFSFITRAIPTDFRILGYASATKVDENRYLVVYSDSYKKYNGLEDAEYFQFYVTIKKHPQMIDIPPIPPLVYDVHNLNVVPHVHTQSGLPYQLLSSDTSIVKVVGDTLKIVGVGKCEITAFQSGNYWYDSARQTKIIEIRKANQNIVMPPTDTFIYGESNLKIPVNTDKGLSLRYEITDTNVVKLIQDSLVIVGSGMCVVTAISDGNEFYNPVLRTQTIVIQKANQSVNISILNTLRYGQDGMELPRYSNVGLPMSYNISDTSVLKIQNDSLIIVGTGICEFTYLQIGNIFYNSIYSSKQIIVEKANQEINVPDQIEMRFLDKYLIHNFNTSVNLPITYTTTDTSIIKITDSAFISVSPGICTIIAENRGTNLYNPVSTIIHCKIERNIPINDVPLIDNREFADRTINLPQFSSNNLPIEYYSLDTNILRFNNGRLEIVGAGDCQIRSYQHGNDFYEPVEAFQVIHIEKSRQNIDIDTSKIVTYYDRKIELPKYSNVDLPIQYYSSDTTIAKVVNGEIILLGIGECDIIAEQNGSSLYKPLFVSQHLYIDKSQQSIDFQPLHVNTSSKYIKPHVQTSSGLPINIFSSDTSVAKVVNGFIEIVGNGTCYIYAEQMGNDYYYPSDLVFQQLKVDLVDIYDIQNQEIEVFPNPASDYIFVRNCKNSKIFLYSLIGEKLYENYCNLDFSIPVSHLPNGEYLVKIETPENKIKIIPVIIKK